MKLWIKKKSAPNDYAVVDIGEDWPSKLAEFVKVLSKDGEDVWSAADELKAPKPQKDKE